MDAILMFFVCRGHTSYLSLDSIFCTSSFAGEESVVDLNFGEPVRPSASYWSGKAGTHAQACVEGVHLVQRYNVLTSRETKTHPIAIWTSGPRIQPFLIPEV